MIYCTTNTQSNSHLQEQRVPNKNSTKLNDKCELILPYFPCITSGEFLDSQQLYAFTSGVHIIYIAFSYDS